MREHFINYLACPSCQNDLIIHTVHNRKGPSIESGELKCPKCQNIFPIVRSIPRFVSSDNYARGFGFQWLKYREIQLDSYSGLNISQKRFFEQTRWPQDLKGQLVLEAGSGAGRFTEHACKTGATVISLDLSLAVEANYENNGHNKNVLILQSDIYHMPLKKSFFDKVFCFGVLQHTPDPQKAFMTLTSLVKKNGQIAIDVYHNYWKAWVISKYYLRPLTIHIPPEKLYQLVTSYIDGMWPICSLIRKIPHVGPKLNLILGVPDHSDLGLKDELLKQWAYLDCFDMFAARYDYPQTLKQVKEWFSSADIPTFEVEAGQLGFVVGRATL